MSSDIGFVAYLSSVLFLIVFLGLNAVAITMAAIPENEPESRFGWFVKKVCPAYWIAKWLAEPMSKSDR